MHTPTRNLSRRRQLLLATGTALCAAGFATLPSQASAVTKTVGDGDGRRIAFDVGASVSVAPYGQVLANAIHGDEIEDVTIRIVSQSAIRRLCGQGAAACYSPTRRGAQITIPNIGAERVKSALLHEYGHHIDATRRHRRDAQGLDGTQRWWSARGMGAKLNTRQVAYDYSRGWSRSIGEIYAEDYAWLNGGGGRYAIGWLSQPSQSILNAMRRDLNAPAQAAPPSNSGGPNRLDINRRGVLAPGKVWSVPFGLRGPGRRVTATVKVRNGGGTRTVSADVVCNGRRVATKTGNRKNLVHVNRANLGPADCELRVRSHRQAVSFNVTLTLRR
jgi:hypothetical protein